MNKQIILKEIEIIRVNPLPVDDAEFVERKGVGHPDTLADDLAEALSRNYSNYTKTKYGAVLHHNFDKLGLLGGKSFVKFGRGYLIKPIRVLVNGRVSTSFAGKKIPYKKIIESTILEFFQKRFPKFITARNVEIHYNLTNNSSPGRTEEKKSSNGFRRYWFEPRGLEDIPELNTLVANDTSLGCAHAPLSTLEKLVLDMEKVFNSPDYKKLHPWCGTDMKIMATKVNKLVDITMCVPQIANFVKDVGAYQSNIHTVKQDAMRLIKSRFKNHDVDLSINTRDDIKTFELYLTAIGSSIESGDEGLVGRGNRVDGLISVGRPMSMEGASGKNPVYHIGKLYNIAALNIARQLHAITKAYSEVFLVSQSGRNLMRPWKTVVKIASKNFDDTRLKKIVEKELDSISDITTRLLKAKIQIA